MPENMSGNNPTASTPAAPTPGAAVAAPANPSVAPTVAADPNAKKDPDAEPKKSKKSRLLFIVPMALLVIAAAVYLHIQNNKFFYAGTVEATEVDVASQVASNVASLQADEGQAVTLGQPLLTLEGTDYKLAQSLANDDYNRGLKLYQSGSMPKETFNHLKSQKELSDLHVQWCAVTAPLNAIILTKYHQPGDWVGPGTKLFTLGDLSLVWCYFYVPQPILVKLSYGQKINASLAEMKGKSFEGVITHINDEAEFTPKNVQTEQERTRLVYAIKVTFKNPDGLLKPGMTLEAELPKK